MPMFRVTKKLAKALKVGLAGGSDLHADREQEWFADLFHVEGKKAVIWVHRTTLLTCVRPQVTSADLREHHALFGSEVTTLLSSLSLPESLRDLFGVHEPHAYAPTDARRVVGSMLEYRKMFAHMVQHGGGLERANVGALNVKLNEMPMSVLAMESAADTARGLEAGPSPGDPSISSPVLSSRPLPSPGVAPLRAVLTPSAPAVQRLGVPSKSTNRRQPRKASAPPVEWLAARIPLPGWIVPRQGDPVRPDVMIYFELPSGLVVGSSVLDLEAGDCPVDVLKATLEAPAVGPPRSPDRIRVEDPQLAEELRSSIGASIDVVVGATPELEPVVDGLYARMARREGQSEASYFEDGRVSRSSIDALFAASAVLYGVAPWRAISDSVQLRVDMPDLGMHGHCMAVIGALGESFGFVLFPSPEGLAAFSRAAGAARAVDGTRIDLGTDTLALNFERAADLPPRMRCEITEHGLKAPSASAYPVVQRRQRDAVLAPLTERDVLIATRCAAGLAGLCLRYREALVVGEPVSVALEDDQGPIRLTAPYEAYDMFEPDGGSAARGAARIGRNDPCPCGSGKKYKRCCLKPGT